MAIGFFVLGIAVGIPLHCLIMKIILNKLPDTSCDCCEWLDRKKSIHKKSRHKK